MIKGVEEVRFILKFAMSGQSIFLIEMLPLSKDHEFMSYDNVWVSIQEAANDAVSAPGVSNEEDKLLNSSNDILG